MNYKFLITILFIGLIGLIGIISPIGVFAASNTTLDFDGGNDYVVANDNAVFDQANRLSISVWIQPDTAPGDEYIVYRFNHYHLKINSSREIVGSVNTDDARVTSDSAITCDGSAWTHIELTYDKDAGGTDEIKLYINGVLDKVGDYSTAISSTLAEKLYVGASDLDGLGVGVGVTNWFDGKIDDVRLYQYARSASDVRLDYNDGLAVRLGGSQTSNSSGSLTSAGCSLDPASCMDYGLVASYDMDEGDGQTLYNAADTGSANDGTLGSSASADSADPKWINRSQASNSSGSLTSDSSGALSFDGVNDYVNCGSDPSLDITGNLTIEMWVKLTSLSDTAGIFSSKGSFTASAQQYAIWTGWLGSYLKFFRTDGASYPAVAMSPAPPLNEWIHIVAVSDTKLRWYLNGNPRGEVNLTITPLTDTTNARIIGRVSANYFNGSIDSVRIYNRALSAEEVRYHYNRGGPVAHWRFDEGEGQTAFDETGNNNDGTLGASTAAATDDPTWVAGKYGSALNFDGIDDYVDVGDITETSVKTVELWVKPDAVNVTEEPLDLNGTKYVKITSGIVSGEDFTSPTIYIDGSTGTTITAAWHHIAITTNTGFSASDVDIGRLNAVYFHGSIDDVRIYNYARTQEQILMDYNAGYAAHLK